MPLVILDRDGVINHDSPNYIKTPDEWQPIDGSLEAMAALNQAGYHLAIASNQAGIARGIFTEADLAAIHAKMLTCFADHHIALTDIMYCQDGPDSDSTHRKPAPGMLLDIMRNTGTVAADTTFIGDKYSDYQAAQNAGCHFALVKTGNGEKTLSYHPELCQSAKVYATLADFANDVLSHE